MRFFKMVLLYVFGFLFVFVAMYFVADAILSRIPSPKNKLVENSKQDYTIYLLSNDVHTDIVFPVKTDLLDWRQIFPTTDTKSQDSTYKWVGIGWGDKGFYLNTPEWKDLTAKTALVAALGIGETALHITYHHHIREDKLCYKVNVDHDQYQLLIDYVLESLETKENKKPIYIETTAQYGDSDAFYEALGSYSMFYSCNTWTNQALKNAKLPSGIWTVFDKGILRWYRHG
ncbi:MAG: TIGR02117 family protein [Sphingobacterium composti]|uniref:TIGR02117 family protein n=1 Tax=Sphingobacterium composti TaxID=363260 RepID=UPI001358813B|nr:TIGR02117 family protein [Sphingobacterium composti Ten et al. 2007 non Yoo et al. 2007]